MDEFEFLDFDARDEIDAETEESFREVLTGLPARPGVRR